MRPSRTPVIKSAQRSMKWFLKLLHTNGSIFQLAAMGVKPPKAELWQGFASGKAPIVLGWFHDLISAEKLIKSLNSNPEIEPKGIYVSLNPVNPALLSRSNNRLKASIPATKDQDILLLQHLLIDIDPSRPSETNSSNKEHELALKKAIEIKNFLKKGGWTNPIIIDSGNGAALIYRLPDLANESIHRELLKNCLIALARRFNEDGVKIDVAVSNPNRLVRVPGTVNRKGDPTQDRPQRCAKIIAAPKSFKPVSLERIKALAATCSEEIEPPHLGNLDCPQVVSGRLDIQAYLEHNKIQMRGIKPYGDSILYVLEKCVFDPSHQGGEAAIGLSDSGTLFYKCFHSSCQKRTWKEARKVISGDASLASFIVHSQSVSQRISELSPPLSKLESTNLSTFSLTQLMSLPREDNPILIDKICYSKTPVLITGATGIGKSELALALSLALASGGLFVQEWNVIAAHRVLCCQSENTISNLQDRINRLPHDWSERRQQSLGNIFLLGINGGIQLSGSLVDKNGEAKPLALKIREKIRELNIDVVLFDPLSSFHRAEENDNTQMRSVLDFILNFICSGSTVTPVVIHHHGKWEKDKGGSYQSRGASAVSDWAGAHLSLTWVKGKKGLVKADWVKLRDFPRPDPITLRRGQDGRFQKVEENKSGAVPVQDVRVLLESMGGRSQSKEELVRQILKDLKVSRGTALKAIDDAEKKGLIHKAGSRKGKASPYSLTGDNKNE